MFVSYLCDDITANRNTYVITLDREEVGGRAVRF